MTCSVTRLFSIIHVFERKIQRLNSKKFTKNSIGILLLFYKRKKILYMQYKWSKLKSKVGKTTTIWHEMKHKSRNGSTDRFVEIEKCKFIFNKLTRASKYEHSYMFSFCSK